jgi:Na+-transporting NADH:ubiquinone oxidoreductase subunit NqrB
MSIWVARPSSPGNVCVSGESEAAPRVEAEHGAWARPLSNRIGEMLMAVALLGAAAFFIAQSLSLPFGGIGLPGPGFFPFALGCALALLALATLVRAIVDGAGEDVYLGHRDILIVFAALAGVAATFETLGAYVSLGTFMAILLLVVAGSALWRVALGTGVGMVAVWVVFKVLLGVQLPAGPF